jgi:hypothetical protein
MCPGDYSSLRPEPARNSAAAAVAAAAVDSGEQTTVRWELIQIWGNVAQ